jgi:hypothetical protein
MEILTHAWTLHRPRRKWAISRTAWFTLIVILGTRPTAGCSELAFDEYQVKAAFLYNFAKFVQWPAEAFQTANEPIVICILGQDPFGRSLEDIVIGRAIEGRSLTVRHISSVKQVTGCHMMFISAAEYKSSPPMLSEIKTPGVLTIGDSDASAADGVVINFKLAAGKVRFEINVEAAEREKLRISSRLLSLAQIVDPKKK